MDWRNTTHLLVAAIASAMAVVAFAIFRGHTTTYHYNKPRADLIGVLRFETFAGLPNFKNIQQGDDPETCVLLKLATPIDVIAENEDEFSPTERAVAEIQLVVRRDQFGQALALINKSVAVSGRLVHAATAHDHRPVLLVVGQPIKQNNHLN